MRLRFLVFVCLAAAALLAPISNAMAAPDKSAAIAQFKAKCTAAGGTLKTVKLDVLTCTAPSGGSKTCDFSGNFTVCYGEDPPAYDGKAAQTKFITQCMADGGKIKRTPKRGVLICVSANGFEEKCDFTNAFGTVCTQQEPPKTFDHSSDIGKQAAKCLSNGGSFTSGADHSFTCTLPDGSGQTCWYPPDSEFSACSGFITAGPNKTQPSGSSRPGRGGGSYKP